ncbi:hypothetical protein VQ335_004319 [Salmonella enterica]|nr:hypothetical protein [Salmonella enterica]EIK2562345.1 hypothetical protein [Salmonella enterica]EKA6272937.1 hypothetical protein [Salmonella enterica]EKO2289573.1 hypothetical protein [Salmonella enterica]EKT6751937.1 hypothetical protein [Salmonella enterica]
MSLPFRRDIAVIVSLLFLYWGLSFATEYFLNEHPLSAEAWQKMRLQVLLVTVSLVITTGRFFVLDTSDRREAMQVMLLVMLILHVLALLLPSVWLFYQWQWDGEFLMQWQGYVFGLALLVLPAAVIIFSS